MGKWVSVKEACEQTGYSSATIYALVSRNEIVSKKNGRKREIDLQSLIEYYNRKAQEKSNIKTQIQSEKTPQSKISETAEIKRQNIDLRKMLEDKEKELTQARRQYQEYHQQNVQLTKKLTAYQDTIKQYSEKVYHYKIFAIIVLMLLFLWGFVVALLAT